MGLWFKHFYFSKYVEYMDTVFLIFGHKYGWTVGWYLQLYHHATTASIAWVAFFYPTPSAFMGLVTNTFVHVIMYAYYAISSVDNRITKWSAYVTYIQLAQFYFCVFLGVVVAILVWSGYSQGDRLSCSWIVFMYFTYMLLFIWFFADKHSGKKSRKGVKEVQ